MSQRIKCRCARGEGSEDLHRCGEARPPYPSAGIDLGPEAVMEFAQQHEMPVESIERVEEHVCLNCGGTLVTALLRAQKGQTA